MVFQGRHGLLEQEQREAQPFEVDVELLLNLQPAAVDDRDLRDAVLLEELGRASHRLIDLEGDHLPRRHRP